jgi:hypothetical protein
MVSQGHDAGHYLLPRNRLHVLVGDVEQVEVEIADIEQPPEIKDVLYGFPNEVKRKHPKAKIPEARHVSCALRDDDLGQLLATAKLAVVQALSQEGQQEGYERDVAGRR